VEVADAASPQIRFKWFYVLFLSGQEISTFNNDVTSHRKQAAELRQGRIRVGRDRSDSERSGRLRTVRQPS
jgi:hypothetical protein